MNRLTKRNLTSLFCLLLLSLLLLQAVGCKDTPQNGEQEQLTTQAQPEISTEADAQPEPVCALTLSAQSLRNYLIFLLQSKGCYILGIGLAIANLIVF